jgi:hypothetical protein
LCILFAGHKMWAMVAIHINTCDKCKRVNPVSFTVEPEEAWKTVVLNRWKKLCPSCFDLLAEQAGVAYSLRDLEGMSWSEKPVPRHGSRCKRQR